MATKQQMVEKYFTKEGVEFIKTKIKTMSKLCNDNQFPIKVQILGFGILKVETQEEMVGRIIELSELIGFQINVKIIEEDKIRYEVEF